MQPLNGHILVESANCDKNVAVCSGKVLACCQDCKQPIAEGETVYYEHCCAIPMPTKGLYLIHHDSLLAVDPGA